VVEEEDEGTGRIEEVVRTALEDLREVGRGGAKMGC